MGVRKYLEKFLNAFSEAVGYAMGIGIVLIPFSLLVMKILENIRIDESTAQSFAILLATMTLLFLAVKMTSSTDNHHKW